MVAPQHEFVASLLDRSASAFANLAAQRLLVANPAITHRYGAKAQSQWRFNLTQRVHELATAVELQAPALFAEAVRWSSEAFTARDLPANDLRASLDSLREILLAELPPEAGAEIENHFTPALRATDAASSPPAWLDPKQPLHRLGLGYIEACLEGEPERAVRMVIDAIEKGLSVPDACLDVLAPSLAEVGWLWHAGRIGIYEEHAVTATTQRLLGLLAETAPRARRNGKTMIGATVQGNTHDTAIRIIALLFEMEGWKSLCLGTELPPEDIACSVQDLDAHLVVISATLIPQLRMVRRTIVAVRSVSPQTKILVGGQAFSAAPEVARSMGADGFNSSARGVVDAGAQLVGMK